jgi:hypothetical protein
VSAVSQRGEESGGAETSWRVAWNWILDAARLSKICMGFQFFTNKKFLFAFLFLLFLFIFYLFLTEEWVCVVTHASTMPLQMG